MDSFKFYFSFKKETEIEDDRDGSLQLISVEILLDIHR